MIDVQDVIKIHKRGQLEVHALRGVSCQISQGSFTFILGPSGSGKSTLLYLLGIEHTRFTYKFQGLDFRLTGVEPSRVVKEIIA